MTRTEYHEKAKQAALSALSTFVRGFAVQYPNSMGKDSWSIFFRLSEVADISFARFKAEHRMSPNEYDYIVRGVSDMPLRLSWPIIEYVWLELEAREEGNPAE